VTDCRVHVFIHKFYGTFLLKSVSIVLSVFLRLNYGVITLVPKIKEVNNIKQYKPICLVNVDDKVIKTIVELLLGLLRSLIKRNLLSSK
jgi:hypothetical protein